MSDQEKEQENKDGVKPEAEQQPEAKATEEATPDQEAPAEPEGGITEAEADAPAAEVAKQDYSHLRAGQTVRMHLRISEGKKDRIQVFEGMILGLKGTTPETRTVTVRKQSKGYGVEKIIPLNLPALEKVELVKKAKVRRSKLYYLRDYKKRLREKMVLKK